MCAYTYVVFVRYWFSKIYSKSTENQDSIKTKNEYRMRFQSILLED